MQTMVDSFPFAGARWIGSGDSLGNWDNPVLPAPFFRTEFVCGEERDTPARVALCGLGYYELYINGRRVGDQVLDPVFSQYDRHCRYVIFDVTEYLLPGTNCVGVILGNGWYNSHVIGWHFDKAPWREYPKLLLALHQGTRCLLKSSSAWRFSLEGPIIFDGMRNGEHYDAAREFPGWNLPGFDDSAWKNAAVVAPPAGTLELQEMPPCRIVSVHPGKPVFRRGSETIFRLPFNMAGWARISVRGPRGSSVTLRYAERLNEQEDDLDMTELTRYIYSGEAHTDRYRLAGRAEESWEPRFVYHGFLYVKATCSGGAEILKLEGCRIHTAFDEICKFSCSKPEINALWNATCNSYLSNFTGIPTDCPHREQNGWTGDALYAAETGLSVYDAGPSYAMWLRSMEDAQRPSGQFPGIVPTSGWGYNWGSGPAWDSVFIQLPWYLYLYTGDSSVMARHYDAMRRYLDFLDAVSEDRIISLGLGDWSHPQRDRMTPAAFTSTAWYARDCAIVAKTARLLGKREEEKGYRALAAEIADAVNREFRRAPGVYCDGQTTAQAVALEFELVPPPERAAALRHLVEEVRARSHRAFFGLIGAKYVPRALAENGFPEDAWRILSQPECPGWISWIRQGSTTLWEHWADSPCISRNHILFGDVNAWMRQFLAGLRPDERFPGFRSAVMCPYLPEDLEFFQFTIRLPAGEIFLRMHRDAGKPVALLRTPRGEELSLPPGEKSVIPLSESGILPDGLSDRAKRG